MRDLERRIRQLEQREPLSQRRIVIIGEDDPEPIGADFVIRIVAARFPDPNHA